MCQLSLLSCCCTAGIGQYDEGGGDPASFTQSTSNPFTASVSPSVQGVPLQSFGTNLIYRDVDELHSLSAVSGGVEQGFFEGEGGCVCSWCQIWGCVTIKAVLTTRLPLGDSQPHKLQYDYASQLCDILQLEPLK